MKYEGTFACGHEGEVDVTGKRDKREWLAEKKFAGLCPECYEKMIQEKREKENKEALEKAKEMELPALNGTEKQISWANTIRQKFIDSVETIVDKNNDNKKVFLNKNDEYEFVNLEERIEGLKDRLKQHIEDNNESKIEKCKARISDKEEQLEEIKKRKIDNYEIIEIENYILNNVVSASDWIDLRDKNVSSILNSYLKSALKTEEEIIEEIQKKEVMEESIVKPTNCIKPGIVEISIVDNTIIATYEKDSDFKEIVKGLGFSWRGQWERKINKFNGPIEDRAAELGNELLNKGFAIYILNKDIREMAINGLYSKEIKNWILSRVNGEYAGRLVISWEGFSDTLYNRSKKLPSAIWDRGMVIKPNYFKEVEEFARLYNFNFSDGALKLINDAKIKYNNCLEVEPAKVLKEKQKDGLEEILNSSTDILDDLKEED